MIEYAGVIVKSDNNPEGEMTWEEWTKRMNRLETRLYNLTSHFYVRDKYENPILRKA